eukprot:m.52809 g.52809  ORF g.52809 m.52809 type:complete len:262 (-) comp7401_c0_seq1:397-1182(-)
MWWRHVIAPLRALPMSINPHRSATGYAAVGCMLPSLLLHSARSLTSRVERGSIDLRSDTVTSPSRGMREAMANALVGDDVYEEDPTVTRLQNTLAAMAGKDAALFVPSGTMGNLVSLAAHCARGDEIILGHGQHIFKYEGGGASAFLGVSYATIPNQPDGTMKLDDILSAVRPDDPHYPRTAVVCLENTHNSCGGRVLPVDYIDAVGNLCKEHKLACHIDGTVLHRLNQTLLGQSWPHSYVHVVDVDNECFGTAKNASNTD